MVRTWAWDGARLQPWGEAPSLAAASATLPDGAYTSLRTYGGRRVLRLREHAERLSYSATAPLDLETLRAALAAAVLAAGHDESRVRATWAPPRLFVSVEAWNPMAPALYAEGATCVTVPVRRPQPDAKDTRFIATAGRAYAQLPPGAHEGLMVSADGALLEGLSSNLFLVVAGVVRTDDAHVLRGVTRSLVLEIARECCTVDLKPVTTRSLPRVTEAFLTSVSRQVMPIARIDTQRLPEVPGPVTAEIAKRFAQRVEKEAEPLF